VSHRLNPIALKDEQGKRFLHSMGLTRTQRCFQIPFWKSSFSTILIPSVSLSGVSRNDAIASPVVIKSSLPPTGFPSASVLSLFPVWCFTTKKVVMKQRSFRKLAVITNIVIHFPYWSLQRCFMG